MLFLLFGAALLGSLVNVIVRDGLDLVAIAGLVMMSAIVVAPVLFALRPAITLADDEVVIRHPLRTHRVPLRDITDVSAGYSGVVHMSRSHGSGRRAARRAGA